jgi:hypothetical protein
MAYYGDVLKEAIPDRFTELLRRLVATTEAEREEDGTDTSLSYRSPVARLSTRFTLTEGSASQTLHIAHGAS